MFKTIDGLHYCPDNGWFGDPMPVLHDGEYHIYFNKPFRASDGPQGDFRGGWGHIGTKDFLRGILCDVCAQKQSRYDLLPGSSKNHRRKDFRADP